MNYLVVYERAPDGTWGAYLPDVPGVVTAGESRAEVEEGIREAFTLFVQDAAEHGQTLPAAFAGAGELAA